ncbi:MAG: 3-phosphoshikimate 1-carboxyvinyltransferase, partial [Bacteroidetes bacterium]|nr:3-phosphoshikimate 1-carboxyvinyltransferase [Bacteroidota bacterium]
MSSKSIKILSAQKHLNCTIKLTGSKSESNRALIMEALSEGAVQVLNVSEAADTVTLKNILHAATNQPLTDQPKEVNIGPAGTAMRFLSAFYTLQNGEIILTGSERMKQRPI